MSTRLAGSVAQMKMQNVATTAALFWAVGAAAFFLFAPVYGTLRTSYSTEPDGRVVEGPVVQGHRTGLDVNGPEVLIALTIPILIAAAPLAAAKARRGAQIVAGALLLVFSILGAASVGMLYVPSALLLLIGAIPQEGARAS